MPEDIAETSEAHQRMLEGKVDSISFEKRYLRKDGSWTWARLTIAPQRDSEGACFISSPSSRTSVTAKWRGASGCGHEGVAAKRGALSPGLSVEFRFNRYLQLEDGRFIDVNEAFLRVLGFKRQEVIGRTSMELASGITRDRQKLVEEMGKNSVCRNLEVQYRPGRIIALGLLSVSAFEMHGVPCILSVTRDVTDAKLAEERWLRPPRLCR